MSESDEETVTRLLNDLKVAAGAPYAGDGPERARGRAVARRRSQRVFVAVAAVVVVAIVAVGVVVGLGRTDDTDRLRPVQSPEATSFPSPAGSPSPVPGSGSPSPESPSPDPIGSSPTAPDPTGSPSGSSPTGYTSLGPIDWNNSVVNLPPSTACTQRRVQFTNGEARFASVKYGRYEIAEPGPFYSDLNGDGLTDAVVMIACFGGTASARFMVIAYTGNEKGGPTPFGLVDELDSPLGPELSVENGGTVAVVWADASSRFTRRYRWNGTKFVMIGETR